MTHVIYKYVDRLIFSSMKKRFDILKLKVLYLSKYTFKNTTGWSKSKLWFLKDFYCTMEIGWCRSTAL